MVPYIVGIRFQKVGKIYHFDASSAPDLQTGDFAVVETSRGRQLGQVIQVIQDPSPPPEGPWKPIQRKATPQDLVLRQTWQQKEIEAMISCRAKASELKLAGVKIVSAEFSFDGARLAFLYSTETEDKVDLRALRRMMQRLYPHTQVEMHQIGPRDVAKILGGMGACGLENRCCSMFLTEFSPVSIKMAKDQGISLTPSEITGMCGRLRCCLVYEYEQYVEARKNLPKRGKKVVTQLGNGKVVDVLPLKQAVIVELESGVSHEFIHNEIQPWDELEALKQKSQAPCDKHDNGECDCGKNRVNPSTKENKKAGRSGEDKKR
jgi:cell fate regulator YaaT (PSP1 superfamily)